MFLPRLARGGVRTGQRGCFLFRTVWSRNVLFFQGRPVYGLSHVPRLDAPFRSFRQHRLYFAAGYLQRHNWIDVQVNESSGQRHGQLKIVSDLSRRDGKYPISKQGESVGNLFGTGLNTRNSRVRRLHRLSKRPVGNLGRATKKDVVLSCRGFPFQETTCANPTTAAGHR